MDINLTNILVLLTGLISYMAFNNRELFNRLKHYPYQEHREKEYYRMLSSGFVHGSMTHLLINLFVFYQFGGYVESYFVLHHGLVLGRVLYLLVYLGIIVLADVASYYKHKDNPSYASIGASGGVSGIIFIFCFLNPWSMLGLYFIIPIPAIIFAVLYLYYSSWASKNSNDNIDHDAHFYGAILGILMLVVLIPSSIKQFLSKIIEDFPWF